jgi:hypothetical protein
MIECEANKLADGIKDNTVADVKAHMALDPGAKIEENCKEREQVGSISHNCNKAEQHETHHP